MGSSLSSVGWTPTGEIDPRIYKRIDLGSGPRGRTPSGFVRVDNNPETEPDVLCDLTVYPWPFEDSSVHEVRCSHFLEHLARADWVPFFRELYRVCAHGAIVNIAGPHWRHVDAIGDPTHKSAMDENFWAYLGKEWRIKSVGLENYAGLGGLDFGVEQLTHVMEPEWEARTSEANQWGMRYYSNAVKELRVWLRVYKPAREVK